MRRSLPTGALKHERRSAKRWRKNRFPTGTLRRFHFEENFPESQTRTTCYCQSSDANGTFCSPLKLPSWSAPHDARHVSSGGCPVREVMNMLEVTDEKNPCRPFVEMCRRTELGGIGGLVAAHLELLYLPELKRKTPCRLWLGVKSPPDLFMDTYEKYIRKIQRKTVNYKRRTSKMKRIMETQEMQFPYTSLTKTELAQLYLPEFTAAVAQKAQCGLPATGN